MSMKPLQTSELNGMTLQGPCMDKAGASDRGLRTRAETGRPFPQRTRHLLFEVVGVGVETR